MLYDTKWQKYTYAGVYLPSFVAWLSTKPRDEKYPFLSPENCAVGQYLQDIGHPIDDVYFTFDADWSHWLLRLIGAEPHTFGELHDRARALMDSAQ